jgi:6-phosphogluconolactonase
MSSNSSARPFAARLFAGTIPLMAALIAADSGMAADEPQKFRAYVGTYTDGDSQGIYTFEFDASSGKAGDVQLAVEVTNPSFLAIRPDGEYLYAVNEVASSDGKSGGAVAAFRIDRRSGRLELLNQASTVGAGPCHLVVDKTGRFVLVANYGGGSVASLPIGDDGRIGEAVSFIQHEGSGTNPQRQEAPHAHSINLDAANRFAMAADLGLDKVLVYRFDESSGELTPNDPPAAEVAPGSGPRHFAFHPGGEFAYVINEMLLTVTAFDYDAARGRLSEIQTITTLPRAAQAGDSTAEVLAHPSGKFLYGSNRGHNSIAIFRIDESNGKLTAVGHQPTQGKTPRNFYIDPTGAFLLAENQGSGTIVIFRIDQETGKLTPTGDTLKVGSPVCIRMVAIAE